MYYILQDHQQVKTPQSGRALCLSKAVSCSEKFMECQAGQPASFSEKRFLRCQTGAASGTTAPTPSRPYRVLHFSRSASSAVNNSSEMAHSLLMKSSPNRGAGFTRVPAAMIRYT